MPPFLPHPPLYLSEIRPLDILSLILLGVAWETIARTTLLLYGKLKSSALRQQEAAHATLLAQVAAKRKLGQAAFVETSKLERQLLTAEKALDVLRTARKKRQQYLERILLRYGNMLVSLVLFVLYYGVPVVALEPLELELSGTPALKTMLFPVSYVGIGMRVAKFGLPDGGVNQVGALVVFWSGQVAAGQVWDAIDAAVL